jgi:hypothetical protein
MMTLQGALRRAWDFVYLISGSGSWRLRPHEQLVVDAAIEDLPADIRKTVRAQLEQAFFVERTSDRIYVLRFYETRDELRIADPAFERRLVKIQLEFDGRTQNAHVTFHRGYLFSIEFEKPAKFYRRKKITVCGVRPGEPGESYTKAIDRLEHGRSEEDEY